MQRLVDGVTILLMLWAGVVLRTMWRGFHQGENDPDSGRYHRETPS